MIQQALFHPKSIVLVGGSANTAKPGGKIIENLKNSPFNGELFVVNPKEESVQGLTSYHSIDLAPPADLAILAIPARFCPESIEMLCQKGTRAFIVISAGFSELDDQGKALDREILQILDRYGASLLGPNCIGLIHQNHHSVFTTPVPELRPDGIEFISSSGSTAVFILEAGMVTGIPFSNVYTVGNALQIRVEDILEHLDETFDPATSSPVKMIYIENIDDPQKFIHHARNLRRKGAHLVALKAGMTEAGSRAASSHTGAMASPAVAVEAMFQKAGVIQCHSRQELLYTAAILLKGKPEGKNIAIITHAGGAGVLLTDALERNGLRVPEITGPAAEELLAQLYPGSTVRNPIDFLATGTREQLEKIIDFCSDRLTGIDAMAVIFGSPGLFDVAPVYRMLQNKIKSSLKPVYPILPSPVNNRKALEEFRESDGYYFEEETRFGEALARVLMQTDPAFPATDEPVANTGEIRSTIDPVSGTGYLSPEKVHALLRSAGIPSVPEFYASDRESLQSALIQLPFPIVLKAIGPVHKSDIGGVALNIGNMAEAEQHFNRIMQLPGVEKVLVQPMLSGQELFIGAKKEDNFGHIILFGLGGIFLEVYRDVQSLLTPAGMNEIESALRKLRTYPVLKGIRGQQGIDLQRFAGIIYRVSQLVTAVPEIQEMDLNPLLAGPVDITVVDARIRI
jgi:acetyltransferase